MLFSHVTKFWGGLLYHGDWNVAGHRLHPASGAALGSVCGHPRRCVQTLCTLPMSSCTNSHHWPSLGPRRPCACCPREDKLRQRQLRASQAGDPERSLEGVWLQVSRPLSQRGRELAGEDQGEPRKRRARQSHCCGQGSTGQALSIHHVSILPQPCPTGLIVLSQKVSQGTNTACAAKARPSPSHHTAPKALAQRYWMQHFLEIQSIYLCFQTKQNCNSFRLGNLK